MKVRSAARAAGLAGVLVLAGLAVAGPAVAAPRELVGVVRTLAADTVDPSWGSHELRGRSEDVYRQVLVVGRRSYVLTGRRLRPNARVRVSGDITGSALRADSVEVLGTAPPLPTTGTTRVLVMLAYWTAPDSVTPAQVQSQLFGDSSDWYRDASFGGLGQSGDVTPWMRIAAPTQGCFADTGALMSEARTAAQDLGYVLDAYDNFVLYFPKCGGDAAGYAGWAYVGAPDAWLNGAMDRRVTVHEQGHNYGLYHSHSYLCGGGGLSGSCSLSDYGDPYDAMGSSDAVGHFNASQKAVLGWMGGRTVDLSAGGTTTLAPMAGDDAAPHAAVVRTDSGRSYWLEYRQPVGFDASLPGSGTDGVLVHVAGPGSGSSDAGASLIDVRPEDGIATGTATLRPGQSWITPEGAMIAAGAATATGAPVTVSWPRSASATGNLVANPSFELDTSRWTASQATTARVALSGAPEGAAVAKVTRSTGTSYSVTQSNVATTTAGGTHVATAYVRAASASSVGKQVRLTIRQRTSAGTLVRAATVSRTLSSTFARIAVPLDATSAGDLLSVRVGQLGAAAGDALYVDLVTLKKAGVAMGNAAVGMAWTTLAQDVKRACAAPLRSSTAVDVTRLRAYVDGNAVPATGTTLVRGLIYADAGGGPGTVVARSAEASIAAGSAARWIDLRLASPVRLAPGTYWLALHSGGATPGRYAAVVATGGLRGNDDLYADGASSPFGTARTGDKQLSLYAVGA